jgi:hypothetical protein
MTLHPDHRVFEAYDALERGLKGKDARIKAIMEVIRGTSKNSQLLYAWRKYEDSISRIILNSFLLCNATYDAIRRATGVPMEVIDIYATHLFDTSIFDDFLDRIRYITAIAAHASTEEVAYLQAAMQNGPDGIVWMISGKTDMAPKDVLYNLMMDGYQRSRAHRNASLNSELTRQALRWGEFAKACAIASHKIDPREAADALEELRLALTSRDDTISEHTPGAPRPEEILH